MNFKDFEGKTVFKISRESSRDVTVLFTDGSALVISSQSVDYDDHEVIAKARIVTHVPLVEG